MSTPSYTVIKARGWAPTWKALSEDDYACPIECATYSTCAEARDTRKYQCTLAELRGEAGL